MTIALSVFDVLHAAIMLEDRGARFYAAAAVATAGEEQKLLMRLAEMEQGHALAFRDLLQVTAKNGLNDSAKIDSEAHDYLEALTSGRVITDDCTVCAGDDYGVILNKAMLIEKNSVFFYTAVKETLSEKMTIEKIDQLIAEEVGHFKMLSVAFSDWHTRMKKS